jgi:hypothetical protein
MLQLIAQATTCSSHTTMPVGGRPYIPLHYAFITKKHTASVAVDCCNQHSTATTALIAGAMHAAAIVSFTAKPKPLADKPLPCNCSN